MHREARRRGGERCMIFLSSPPPRLPVNPSDFSGQSLEAASTSTWVGSAAQLVAWPDGFVDALVAHGLQVIRCWSGPGVPEVIVID